MYDKVWTQRESFGIKLALITILVEYISIAEI